LSGVAQCVGQVLAADDRDYTGICDCLGDCLGDCTADELDNIFPNFDWDGTQSICENSAACLESIGNCADEFATCHDDADSNLLANCECWQSGASCLRDGGDCNLPLDVGTNVDCGDFRDIGRAVWEDHREDIIEFWDQHEDEILATIAENWSTTSYTLSVVLSDLNDAGRDLVQELCDRWASRVNEIIAAQCDGRSVCDGLGVVCNLDNGNKRDTDYDGTITFTDDSGSQSLFASLTLLLAGVWVLLNL